MSILSPLAWLYGRVADLRNTLYDKGVLESQDLGVRTISIGNITTGGTGKTPLVAYVAEILAARGEKVCILTRGYGRENAGQRVLVSDGKEILADPSQAGDEPFELAQKLFGRALVIADADRVAAAEWAKRKFGVTAFVLDDGFQYRKAKRDVDIVCIDATNPFGGREMLPAGRLREPKFNLSRAGIVVITRTNVAEDIANIRFEISRLAPDSLVFAAENRIARIVALEEFHAKTQRPQSEEISQPALAFCGLGNPENFFAQLRQDGIEVVSTETFRDHHRYFQQNIAGIEAKARQTGCEVLLTTAKDAVKLEGLVFTLPCYVVEIELSLDNPDGFAALI